MNLEISKYLHQYLKVKFSTYCEPLNKKDFMSFVNAIASNSLLNKFKIDDIKNGLADKTINQLVEKYAQLRFPELWKEKVYNYLNNYIQDKFPMYYKFISKDEYDSFVKNIVSHPVIKEYGLSALYAGDIDKTVDNLVEDYAQLKLTNVWANVGSLCNHIKKVIIDAYSDNDIYINEKTLNDIIKKIADTFIKDSGSYSYYMNGAYDKLFLSSFDAYYDKIQKDCIDTIKMVVKNSNLKVTYDEVTYNYILEQIMNEILINYDIDDIISEKCNNEILEKFDSYCSLMKKNISSYIRNVVNNMDVLLGLPVDVIVSDITKMVVKGELSANKLFNHKYDELIEKYADTKRKESFSNRKHIPVEVPKDALNVSFNENQEKMSVYEYICNYIIENCDKERNLLQKDFEECVAYINELLIRKKGGKVTIEDVKSPEYFREIETGYYIYKMKLESVQRRNLPKETESKRDSKLFPKLVIVLMIAAALKTAGVGVPFVNTHTSNVNSVGIETSSSVNLSENGVSSLLENMKSPIDKFDGYKYETAIFDITNKATKDTAINAYNFHVKIQSGGYDNINYDYLGLYRAYKMVKKDRLYIMDSMLNIVRNEASKKESGSEFHRDITDASCYLEFAMDRLKDMGYDEIDDQKYYDVLFSYLKTKNEHLGKEPLQFMNDDDVLLINDIMEKYREYSDKEMDEFNKLLRENDSKLKGTILTGRKI